ncbi:iron-containing redox enzyme family protein [Streptomyces sp. RB6PN25]|uniref:Iron-containing redox enzyme family protein n=1 Tax=Streptomyces humicola TaxID=2953240 RepID=A0ABT1Q174_9ACTN|nr:iron-containing redox enzyme family protein [Streptomyces humicola]MCQ4083667.1 iron-containing redox enzyme family protein [Streptomyces humicola]
MTARTSTQIRRAAEEPRLPRPRGPVSASIVDALARRAGAGAGALACGDVEWEDPLGEDVQLALYISYELHYRGFEGVDPEWEWDPELLQLRAALERSFHMELLNGVAGGDDIEGELSALLTEPRPAVGVSHFLADEGTWWHMREFFAHRSLYHLKEADPHAWVIPRLRGLAKAALVAVEYDEFGGGHAERVHAHLFADLLVAAGLEARYGRYLDTAPAVTLATVNLMSYLGLHRALRGALVGHFTAAEIANPPSAKRMVRALDRLGAPEPCRRFYSEHIEADAVHEQVMRHDVLGALLAEEPGLTQDAVFGIQATSMLDARLADHLLGSWHYGMTSLLTPLPAVA